MNSRSIETFLFDLDGTLIDSIEVIRRSFRHTLLVHRGWEPPEDEWLLGLGTPLDAQFKHYSDDAAEIERMVATYRKFNAEHHDELVSVYPGALESVQRLAERGAKLGIVTSKQRSSALRGLAHCGFDETLFGVIVAQGDVAVHKPRPEPVLAALERLGASAESAVYVGDSPHDLAAGRAANVATAAALWGPFPRAWLEPHAPNHWLVAPRDVLAI